MFMGRDVFRSSQPLDQPLEGQLPACPLRRHQERENECELICGASGKRLGLEGRDDQAIGRVCGACPIRATLQDPHACLHLRPVIIEQDGRSEALYPCKWLYRLDPARQPRSLWELCCGCPCWSPRPNVAFIPGYWEETFAIREEVADAQCEPVGTAFPRSATKAWTSWIEIGGKIARALRLRGKTGG